MHTKGEATIFTTNLEVLNDSTALFVWSHSFHILVANEAVHQGVIITT